jgi:hypothetical protein
VSAPRVLFVLWHPGQLRYFEQVFALMAERGDTLHVLLERPRERIPNQLDAVRELAANYPNVTIGAAAKTPRDGWNTIGRYARAGLDHLHYFHRRFDDAPNYRARAADAAPSAVRTLARLAPLRRGLRRALCAIERAVPIGPAPGKAIEEFGPDVVVVTPYVWFAGPQGDWTRAAHARGVPVVAAIFSWDNLTSKGSTRATPDVMTVWNEAQLNEAAELHRIPADRIVITGAQVWDLWFEWRPSRNRVAFLEEIGLDPERPLILYLESSGYVGGEGSFAREWLATLADHDDPRLREAAVLVRPHPQANSDDWESLGLVTPGRVAVWPPDGEPVQTLAARQNFFDSLHHADAVVGVNTSAFIEAAIVRRPALTPALPRFRKGQQGTLHFAHLLEVNGGPVRTAATLAEHADQLAAVLREPAELVERADAFVRRFVRPHGRHEAATPRFVDAIEQAARLTPHVPARRPGSRLLHRALRPVARRIDAIQAATPPKGARPR